MSKISILSAGGVGEAVTYAGRLPALLEETGADSADF